MVIISSSDESVVLNAECGPELLEVSDDLVNISLRSDTHLLRLLLDLLTVLVCTCGEHYIIALHSLHSRDSVASKRRIAMSDMRIARRIVDRCSDVECLLICHDVPPRAYINVCA